MHQEIDERRRQMQQQLDMRDRQLIAANRARADLLVTASCCVALRERYSMRTISLSLDQNMFLRCCSFEIDFFAELLSFLKNTYNGTSYTYVLNKNFCLQQSKIAFTHIIIYDIFVGVLPFYYFLADGIVNFVT